MIVFSALPFGFLGLLLATAPVQGGFAAWPDDWVHFANSTQLILGCIGLVVAAFLMIWWVQRTGRWYAVFAGTLLVSMLLNVAALYLFVVPPHSAGCLDLCPGRLGYPHPFATLSPSGTVKIYIVDFVLNLLLLWLMWLGGAIVWRLLSEAVELGERGLRFRLLFVVVFILVPWGLIPRYFGPPSADVSGDELRLAVNARRAAETTYSVTGLWVHRLALEDIRYIPLEVPDVLGGIDKPQAQVCLRGYTYFYLPWRRYRIKLDQTGVTPLNFQELPLTGSCWQS